MAVQDIYRRYDEKAKKANVTRNTKESIDWFRRNLRKDSSIKSIDKAQQGLKSARPTPGGLFIYQYDPKNKDRLDFYDKFPLVFILEITRDGWYGLNLHYMPPAVRARILAETSVKSTSGKEIAERFGRSSMGKYALKRYSASNVRSKLAKVPKADFEIAISLPFENFKKASNKVVWRGR